MKSETLIGLTAALLLSSALARADVEIANRPTSNMSCDSGVCTATARKAVLNVGDLATMLASGDVAVKTGLVAKDIDVDQPLTWSSTARLTLDAQASVTVKKQITVAGQGALTIVTNDTGQPHAKSKTGEFIILPEHGSVQFWDLSSSLIVDGNTYTLVGDIKTLAADIAANPSGFYALAKPYDASVDGTYASTPINLEFTGLFDGLGNEISSISVISEREADTVSFFTWIATGGIVRDIGIVNGTFSGRKSNGVAMTASLNFGLVERCWASGRVSFQTTVGASGLVSENEGTIMNSFSDVRVVGTAARRLGGLVDYNDSRATTASSFAVHSVALRDGPLTSFGGLVGENLGAVENSYTRNRLAAGKKNSDVNLGGLVGKNDPGGTIQTSYAAGPIGGNASTGGVVGFDGAKSGSITASYWDLDMGISNPSQGAGNIPNDSGITGLTTQQFQSGLPQGFDPKIWGLDPKINGGFPYLLAVPAK